MSKQNTIQLRLAADALLAVRRTADLARLLTLTPQRLAALAAQPQYSVFTVPKRDGSQRLIEDPDAALKAAQRRLNDFLQALYYFERSEAAYGFVTNPADDPAPRHIVTHAERHVGCRFLLNIDLDNFFHQVTEARVRAALQSAPLQLDDECAGLVGQLCTWKGRLPMGAPSSPALSNFAFRDADKALTFRARERGWLYTRYADDLSFSTQSATMTPADLDATVAFLEKDLGYAVHPRKRRFCAENDLKTITRLVVTGSGVELPGDFYAELDETLRDLGSACRVQHKMGSRYTGWLSDYEQRIQGMLGFAGHVLGETDDQYLELLARYQEATTQQPEDFGLYSWLDFPYFQ